MTATEEAPTAPTDASASRVARRTPGWGSSVVVHALALGTLAVMATRGQSSGQAVAGPVTLAPADAPAEPPLYEVPLPAPLDPPLAAEPVEVRLPEDPPPPSEELVPPLAPPRALAPAPLEPPPVDRYSLERIPRVRPAPAATAAVADAPAPLVPPRAVATAVTYPRALRDDAPTGVVQLRLLVRADGTVGDVRIHETSGIPALDRAAADAARAWRFEPATRGGVAVEAWVEVPVRFAA